MESGLVDSLVKIAWIKFASISAIVDNLIQRLVMFGKRARTSM